MNRRDFLQALAVAGIVSAAPVALIPQPTAARPSLRIDPMAGVVFQRRQGFFDFNTQIGIAAQMRVGDERYRHGIRLPAALWEQFTPAQQEEAWKCVERMTYNCSRKLPVMTGVFLPRSEPA